LCFDAKIFEEMQVRDTPYIYLELRESGILVARYKRQRKLTLPMAREIVQTRLDFAGREPRPVLVANLGVVEMDKEARRYVSSGDGVRGIKASAILTESLATHFIMSFIVGFYRLPFPVRDFTTEDAALIWLSTFL
jgi:hypothetical protein